MPALGSRANTAAGQDAGLVTWLVGARNSHPRTHALLELEHPHRPSAGLGGLGTVWCPSQTLLSVYTPMVCTVTSAISI